MDALLSRKAKDDELGKAKKNLQETIAYWGTNWNARSLEELPEYLQYFYILYTYTLWLEEQIATLKQEMKDDTVLAGERQDTDIDKGHASEQAKQPDDKGRTLQGTGISQSELPFNQSTDDGRSGDTVSRPNDTDNSINGDSK